MVIRSILPAVYIVARHLACHAGIPALTLQRALESISLKTAAGWGQCHPLFRRSR